MSTNPKSEFKKLLATMFKSHPWHSVSPGDNAPALVYAYIEIVPTGAVKLELDKKTGHLHVDRAAALLFDVSDALRLRTADLLR